MNNCFNLFNFKKDHYLYTGGNEARMKWFFSVYEASDFIQNRIEKNGGKVHEIFIEHEKDYNEIKHVLNGENLIFSNFDFSEIYLGTSWYVLVSSYAIINGGVIIQYEINFVVIFYFKGIHL